MCALSNAPPVRPRNQKFHACVRNRRLLRVEQGVERQLLSVSPITVACIRRFGEGNSHLHELVSEVATRAADKLKFTLGMDFKAAKARVTEYIRRDIGTIAVRGIASMLLLRRRYAGTHQASVAGHSVRRNLR